MSSNTAVPSSSGLPAITVSDADKIDSNKENAKLTKDQGPAKGTKYRDLSLEERFQYRFALPVPPDKHLLTQAGLKIKVGDYEWNVHDDLVWAESIYIRDNIKADSKGMIDLSEFKPELIARMILFCYHDRYPVSPDFPMVPSAKTIAQVLSENRTASEAASSSDVPTEPKFDVVLHLEMYVLAQKLEMKYLAEFAQKKFKKGLAMEGEGFWACVDMLSHIEDDEIGDKVERRIRHATESRVWSTKRHFSDLQMSNPGMAVKISDAGQRRFGQP